MKKLKFTLLISLFLFARGCDFYSTSLWFFQPNGQEGEMNPLTSILGFGWTGLVTVNLILAGIIIYAFYYYTFRYKTKQFNEKPNELKEFVSELYFNEKGHFYQVFYKSPKNKNVFLAHFGYVLLCTIIFGSFLATIHNLCQFYQVSAYGHFRELVKRPLYVIYGLIFLSGMFFLFRQWRREYRAVVTVKGK
ncbi:MAG: hypothetical protein IPP51_17585 [Bacteroidetes bacterium]|nr:hypothetical protein [Bacteroidota bacterium]